MSDIKQKLVETIVSKLTVLGCQFKIIADDGKEYGELVVAEQKKKRNYTVPPGHYKTMYADKVQNIKIGEVVEFDLVQLKVDANAFRSAVSAAMSHTYGKEAHSTHINNKTKRLELFRMK
jgi:hypothetical protein